MDTGGATLSDGCGGNGNPSAVDLFRYNSAESLALNSACIGASTCAGNPYFSYNGGTSNGNPNGNLYNPTANGNDYADFVANTCGVGPYNVQDGTGCAGANPSIGTDGGAEINILDAVGYNLNNTSSVPEPAATRKLGRYWLVRPPASCPPFPKVKRYFL